MRWPRPTTRGSMIAVLGVALTLGLGLPAREVWDDREQHFHLSIRVKPPDEGEPPTESAPTYERFYDLSCRAPFWASYRLRLLGRPWKKQPICGRGLGRIEETCVHARPEILKWHSEGYGTMNSTPEIDAFLARHNPPKAVPLAPKVSKD